MKGKVRKSKYVLLNVQGPYRDDVISSPSAMLVLSPMRDPVGLLGLASEKQGFPSEGKGQSGKCETGSR